MARKVKQSDIVRHGPEIARLKASMPRKRWRRFVRIAHSQGHTVAGQLSGVPNPLKERTPSSLRKQAQRTVAAAYKPVTAELSRRELANDFRAKKMETDDAAYRQWMMGEVDKLDAQARAADATLMAQQSQIATDLKANQAMAQADSQQRMAETAGNVSDTAQSTALDYSAADTKSREQVANARSHSADLQKIGSDADTMSRAAIMATAAVREATRKNELSKERSEITSAREKSVLEQAADAAELLSQLRAGEIDKANANREFGMAANELGFKQDSLHAEVKEANRKFRLDNKKFNLDKWKAQNADLAERARIQLGYDQILAQDGRAAADRAMRQWVERYKAKHRRQENDKRAGVSEDERKLYREVETVKGLIVREHRRGTDPSKIRQRMRRNGFDDATISLAEELRRSGGMLTSEARQFARRIGIQHGGYFWDVAGSSGANAHPR